ncbi:MAG: threonine ammonia-lyase [Deltaproteobacteria bacterium]|nr:threonine ammonia-lyase [Deltaproteobacteria bacterium]
MLDLIKAASLKIKSVMTHTPLIYSAYLTRLYGFDCYLKLENLQKTGSFKARGAFNKISSLSGAEKSRGVITASLGNHAQGVAWAASHLGVKSLIVMPQTTAIVKFVATKGYGAEIILYGNYFDEAYEYAKSLAKERSLAFIPPFDDDLVIAGQGTIGLEILAALPDADLVVVPIGGGGLISGISSALKESRTGVSVVGVEAEASQSCIASLKAGHPVDVERKTTIADGIAVKKVGDKTFSIIKNYVDDVVAVGEETISAAILLLLERKKLIVEGAGAAPLAAAMEDKLPKGAKKAVFVLSGGNIDVTMLDRVIRAGMLKEGRIMRLSTVVEDIPGSLARLTAEIAGLRANILHIIHQREAADLPVRMIRLEIILEVEGEDHAERIYKALEEKEYVVR